jgi:hypothetical protein
LCLLCLWRERNARNFEDVETSVTELPKIVFNTSYKKKKKKNIVLNTLHTGIAAHHSLLVSNFADFLNSCSSFSFI